MAGEKSVEYQLWQYKQNHNNAAKALISIKGSIVENFQCEMNESISPCEMEKGSWLACPPYTLPNSKITWLMRAD
eukprot:3909595-Ditylum_brightwellii.AAC.1